MKEYTPHPYQTIMIDHMLTHERCAVWADMGLGKTSATLTALQALILTYGGPALVIGTKRIAKNVWPAEAKKWRQFNWLTVEPILGSAQKRIEALHRPAHIYSINYENLVWLTKWLGKDWPFKIVIADESTRLKSHRLRKGGARAAALARVTWSKIKVFIELTGTPAPNGVKDLWGQLWFLDRGARLGRTFTAFVSRWFRYPHPNAFEPVPMDHAQGEINAAISDICISLKAEDWFDLDDIKMVDVPVYLEPKVMAMYTRFEKEMFVEILGNKIEAKFAAAKTTKCLQLTNGAVYHDKEGNWTFVHDAKLEAVDSILEECGGDPLLVAYWFRQDLEQLKKRFKQGRVFDDSQKTEDDWNAGKIPIMFIHPASGGHGLNLQYGGHRIVMFSQFWDMELRDQVIARIGPVRQKQAGLNRICHLYDIRVPGTIDDIVLARHATKANIQDLLMQAAKKYNPNEIKK